MDVEKPLIHDFRLIFPPDDSRIFFDAVFASELEAEDLPENYDHGKIGSTSTLAH